MSNPFLGQDLGIPIEDIQYGLPIRWWAHVFATTQMGGTPGMPTFRDWREYLLSWNETTLEIVDRMNFCLFRQHPPVDPTFLPRTRAFLQINNALTLAGFVKFYLKCLEEYAKVLQKEGVI